MFKETDVALVTTRTTPTDTSIQVGWFDVAIAPLTKLITLVQTTPSGVVDSVSGVAGEIAITGTTEDPIVGLANPLVAPAADT